MRYEGNGMKVYSLALTPPKTFKGRHPGNKPATPIFEPYPEALPLESGYYSFVLDANGRLRVERGNTRHHARMAGSTHVGAAGHFKVTRAGKVGMVFCTSYDFWLYIRDEHHPTVGFVIESFKRHQAFELSQHTYFKFLKEATRSFMVTVDGELCHNETERTKLLEEEEQGIASGCKFSAEQIVAFKSYVPTSPPRLYSMHTDQLGLDFDEQEYFELGPAQAPYSPSSAPLSSGRKAFVLDDKGQFIVGYGHQLLSGGHPVGGAGQIIVDDRSVVTTISLNFSGHYRPTLTAEYARYVYGALRSHPLLTFADDCVISARKSFDLHGDFDMVTFSTEEILSGSSELEAQLDEWVIVDEKDEEDDGLIWR